MAPTQQHRSKCKICGDKLLESGNYKFKIKRAKKLPAKAVKLFGDPTKIPGNPGAANANGPEVDESLWGLNKFHTYLKKKFLHPAARSNALIITCKNCSSKSTIPLIKRQLGQKDKSKYPSASSTPTPSLSLFDSSSGTTTGGSSSIFDLKSSRKNAKKGKKASRDLHAGLKIPPSLLNLNSSALSSTSALSATKVKSKCDNNETPLPLPAKASKNKSSPGRKSMSSGSSSTSLDKVKIKKGKKGKDTDGLRRALFFNTLSKDQQK